MRNRLFLRGTALMAAALGGCSPPGSAKRGADAAPDHLRCAAMIAAADRLMVSGTVPRDATLTQHGLVAGMTHLNAFAIPKRLPEKEAFAAVEAERAQILATLQPSQIVEQARACVERTPSV